MTETSNLEFAAQLSLAVNNMSIRSLVQAHGGGRLQLRPAFQRNLVWNPEQKSYLVDSVLRNMPIPEVYIQTKPRKEDDAEVLVVVDGQQRISTCIEFESGKLRLTGGRLDPRWSGRTISEIDPELQERFKSYKLVARDLPVLEDAEIREIFQRLNRVVEPLMPQELRHAAYSGEYIRLIELISSHPVLQELRVFSARDLRRRKSDEFISEVALAVVHEAFPNKKEGLDESFATYERSGLPPAIGEQLARSFGRVFAQLEKLRLAIRRTRFRNKSDFYSLMVLLVRRAESLPTPDEYVTRFEDKLQLLSETVTRIRNVDPEELQAEKMDDIERAALKYLRAVDKAASDRLNRVRRHEVLEEQLGPELALGTPSPLEPTDEQWKAETDNESDDLDDSDADEDEDEDEAGLASVQEALLKD